MDLIIVLSEYVVILFKVFGTVMGAVFVGTATNGYVRNWISERRGR